MEGERKVLQKIDFLWVFFNNVIFIKTSNPALCRQKEFIFDFTVVCPQMTLSRRSFSSKSLLGFSL